MGSNGIDVSDNNGRLTLTKGFSGLDFVIAKATEGIGFTDPTLPWYHAQARQAGVLFGAYHFGHPEQSAGKSEAFMFTGALSAIGGAASGMSLWYDYEAPAAGWQTTPDNDAGVITDFIGHLKDGHPHAKVGIYSNLDGFGRILPILHAAGIHVYDALWLADPTTQAETTDAPLGRFGASWNIHQYEIFHGIDRNYSRWSREQMTAAFTW
jgi:GH25 family lysozyme M1 (1,4-beta-N-acetylmuramidase)